MIDYQLVRMATESLRLQGHKLVNVANNYSNPASADNVTEDNIYLLIDSLRAGLKDPGYDNVESGGLLLKDGVLYVRIGRLSL